MMLFQPQSVRKQYFRLLRKSSDALSKTELGKFRVTPFGLSMENTIKFLILEKISFRCILPLISLFLFILSVDICSARDQKLASSFRKSVVIFRLDDVILTENLKAGLTFNQEFQNDLIDEFVERGIPLTAGVIPYYKDQEVSVHNTFIRHFGQKIRDGMIEIAQHGFRHAFTGKEQTEFRFLPHQSQLVWVERGKGILQRAFFTEINTFIPPWNNYDASTLHALIELKFKCLSGDLGPIGKNDKNTLYGNITKISFIPATCSLREVVGAVKLALAPEFQYPGSCSFIVVCFHPYDFIPSAKRPIEKNELTSILDELKHMPVEFATLMEASTKFGEQLHLSRQVRAARVENLGKALKLIPGLSFLLPTDYHFGRWIPFGVYFPEEVYSSIEVRIIIKISFVLFLIWILFVEGARLVLAKRKHTWNIEYSHMGFNKLNLFIQHCAVFFSFTGA